MDKIFPKKGGRGSVAQGELKFQVIVPFPVTFLSN
jgi:hypothetical protein